MLEPALTKRCKTKSERSWDKAENLPEHWDAGFEPRQIRYLRYLGKATAARSKNSACDVSAESLLSLERRYAKLYTSAKAVNSSRLNEGPVPDDFRQVLRDRVGCYCCSVGCHTCEFCQPYIHREGTLRSLARELEGDDDV